MTATDFIVDRPDFSRARVAPGAVDEDADIAELQILVQLAEFALTANNVSYAATGDFLGYWSFFPTGEETSGRIPVWGFAEVVRSRHPDISTGELVFGIWPPSSYAVLTVDEVTDTEFVDAAPHRAVLHQWYRRYFRCAGDPVYDEGNAALQPIFWPLFMTGWLLAESLAEAGHHGAERVIVASASSKTAYAFAHSSQRRSPEIEVIGLTSAGNVAFVESLGCYDRVITYDDLGDLEGDRATIFVDMAGNGEVRHAVHAGRGNHLVHSVLVGGTHQGAGATTEPLPGPAPVFFFVPDDSERRSVEWGRDRFLERFATAWRTFASDAAEHIAIDRRGGMDAVEAAYGEILSGQVPPDSAIVIAT